MLYGHMIRHLFVDFLFVEFCSKYSNHSDLNSKSLNIVANVIIPKIKSS
jgi:hypothetical protein